MKRKIPHIDISKSVMQRIERDSVRMRSRRFFAVRRASLISGLVVGLSLSALGCFTLSYVLRHDVFIDYKTLANLRTFVGSLPWPGIVVTLLSIVSVVVLARVIRKQSSSFRLSYAFGAWLILLLGIVGAAGSLSAKHTPTALSRAAYWSDKDPSELRGEVIEIVDAGTLKVKVDGQILTVYTNTSGIKVGDKILVLGGAKDNKVYAKLLEVTEKAPEKKKEAKKKPAAKVVATPKPVEPAITPKPEPEPTPAPAPEPKPQPAPAPAKKITYSVQALPNESAPEKYIISWTSNFETVTGWKLPYEDSPAIPSYPGGSGTYKFILDEGATSGQAKFYKSDHGPGTYNIRICAYNTGAEVKCPVYSSLITITFYP